MEIKVIKRAETTEKIVGVYKFDTGKICEATVSFEDIQNADNYDIFKNRINEVIDKITVKIKEEEKYPDFEKKIKVFGEEIIEKSAIEQLKNCLVDPSDIGVLTPDSHFGYNHPIGGAIGYLNKVSLSGVGFDIGCGNKAVMTDIDATTINVKKIMKEISKHIGFGVGRPNPKPIEHEVLEKINKADFEPQRKFLKLASEQLGTVGSSNHFVDLFKDENNKVWIGVHFGSRGFGHRTTTGFIALSQGKSFDDKVQEGKKDARPILFDMNTELGQAYFNAVQLAGEYAYAGRDMVVDKVLEILGAKNIFEVHNHHNFVWKENHLGQDYYVVRKGCTPAFPGQKGFIGANMFDQSVIIEGIDSQEAKEALYSTVHGAGRVLSRTKAAGKGKWQKIGRDRKKVIHTPGIVDWMQVKQNMANANIVLIGGGPDEAPECYKKLNEVLSYQKNSIRILNYLTPIGVMMASDDTVDPYRD